VKPFIWLLQVSSNVVTRMFGIQPAPAGDLAHSEEEIRHIVAGAEEAGVIEATEGEMLYKVFDFADTEVSEVMVPRPDVVALSADLPPEEALQAVLESPYTRYPVYRGSIDDIIGILHVRDLVAAMHDRGIAAVNLEELLRPATMVPETKDLAALLTEFRRTNQHMAIVIDEYGTTEGIVTLEDLLEEIVGEIEDEFDLPDETVERIDDDTIRIDGTFPIDDFNEQFGADLPQTDFHTIAGFVFGALGRTAEPGDEVQHDGMVFRVDAVEGQRIDRLTITFGSHPAGEEPTDEE
jgi:putative hemolysin